MQPSARSPTSDLEELGIDTFKSGIYSHVEINEQVGVADELRQISIDLAPKV